MKNITIKPFIDFSCIADKCKHNCCLNWQIDIDKKSIRKYKRLNLNSGIDYENNRFTMVEKNGQVRCAFLDDDNLCGLIKKYGNKVLCQTCTDHPRYRNFFKSFTLYGIGLACEQALNLLLTYNEKLELPIIKGKTKHEKEIMNFVKEVFDILTDRELFILDRIEKIISLCCPPKRFYNADFKSLLKGTEYICKDWKNKLDNVILSFDKKVLTEFSIEIEKVLWVTVYRHVFGAIDSLDIKSRTLFSVLCILIICSLIKSDSSKEFLDITRQFSEEIEYSSFNINAILDFTDNLVLREK